MRVRFNTKIRFNGREYASADEMPPSVREAYTRAVGETAVLRSGARLADKLNAKVIVNDKEFSSPGELPVGERRLLQDALAALLPNNLALSANEARRIRQKKMIRALVVAIGAAGFVYLWLHGFFG
ncbi:MAG TPA: hypothetical protein VFO30_02815 [Chthoniobacterales bacterium]|nr:hypothetical protein [Chthoniobacterales bacterium]